MKKEAKKIILGTIYGIDFVAGEGNSDTMRAGFNKIKEQHQKICYLGSQLNDAIVEKNDEIVEKNELKRQVRYLQDKYQKTVHAYDFAVSENSGRATVTMVLVLVIFALEMFRLL